MWVRKEYFRKTLAEHYQYVVLAHDEVILAMVAEFLPGIFSVQDYIAYLDGHQVTFLAGANRNDFAPLGLFLGGIRDDDSPFGLLFGFRRFDDYAIVNGPHIFGILGLFKN
jgi:hypothetical protein